MFRDDLLGVERFKVALPDGWATAATVSEIVAFRAPYACVLKAMRFIAEAAVTAHATNFGTLIAQNKGSDGTGTTEMASHAFDTVTTDDVAAYDEVAVPLSGTAANLVLAAGDVVSFQKTADGSGLALDGQVVFEIGQT